MAVPAPYSIFNMINKYINNMLYHVLTHINASNLTLLMIDHILTIVDETWLLSGHLILIRSIIGIRRIYSSWIYSIKSPVWESYWG